MKKIILAIVMLIALSASVFAVSDQAADNYVLTMKLINQDPDPAIAGETAEVRLGLENTGSEPVQNLTIEMVPKYPFELPMGEDELRNIGTLNSFQDGDNLQVVKFKLLVDKDAPAGTYDFVVRYYTQETNTYTQKSFGVSIKNQESAEIIHIDKTTLVPGKEDNLKFTITNVGNAPLRDMTFKWVNADKVVLPVGSDNTRYIKYLDIGESSELTYQVIADTNAEPGLYELSLLLTYDDSISNKETAISTIAGVYVGGATDFEVSFSESSAGETSFSVANIGSNPAYSVSVIIPQQQGWRVSGSNSVIIGNLNNGDYTVASFALQSIAAATSSSDNQNSASTQRMPKTSKSSPLKVQIAYTDTMGTRIVSEKELEFSMQNSVATATGTGSRASNAAYTRMNGGMAAATQQTFWDKYKWAIIILAAMGLVLTYRYYKKNSVKKKK